jgi:type IV fimbrial biogenesis protein FimT
VPAFGAAMERNKLAASTSEFLASLHRARSEAIQRGAAVAVRPADGENWASGWTVFADSDDDGRQDADEQVLVERAGAMNGSTVTAHFGATYSGKVLSYSAAGQLHRPGASKLVVGRLVIEQGGQVRSLCFASTGLRVTARATCN